MKGPSVEGFCTTTVQLNQPLKIDPFPGRWRVTVCLRHRARADVFPTASLPLPRYRRRTC